MSVSQQPVEPGPTAPARRPPDPPSDAERPAELTDVPEGTSRPRDWDVEGSTADGPARPHREDEVREDQLDAQRADRHGRAGGDAASAPERDMADEDESAYTTEIDQGAAQPGPDDADTASDR